jgi:terpene synthase-like protein
MRSREGKLQRKASVSHQCDRERRTAMTTPIKADAHPSAGQCGQIAALTLEILADLRKWAAQHPACLPTTPIEAMAMATAMMSPWRSAAQLRTCARFRIWTFAFDDQAELHSATLDELDELLGRCATVVRTSNRDDSHPVLSALSDCQQELSQQPLYPSLAALWAEKFGEALKGVRYDWIAGWKRNNGHEPGDVQEYIAHAASVLVWITRIPLLAAYEHDDVLTELDVLTAALDDLMVATRLADDLITFEREQTLLTDNNILMYGVTESWVHAELARYAESARRRLAPLVAAGSPPAIEVLRGLEWPLAFYSRIDFRGWGSDAPVTSSPAS